MEQILEFLISLDEKLFLLFNGMQNEFWSYFMPMFTGKFIWIPMYSTILFILYRTFHWKQATVYALGIILTIVLADQVCATFIRPYVERLRPSNLENPLSALTQVVDGYRGGRYGFPSCHASNSFALAAFLSLLIGHRRFTWFILGWALVNSYSRLYLGVHYPGDLIVGGIIGAAIGAIVYFVARWIACWFDVAAPSNRRWGFSVVGRRVSLRDTDTMLLVGFLTAIYILVVSTVKTLMG